MAPFLHVQIFIELGIDLEFGWFYFNWFHTVIGNKNQSWLWWIVKNKFDPIITLYFWFFLIKFKKCKSNKTQWLQNLKIICMNYFYCWFSYLKRLITTITYLICLY
jgi:hypothetical protein